MVRGALFQRTIPGMYCYHPSYPVTRMQAVEEAAAHRLNVLLWAVMGGGAVALPFLEDEMHGPLSPRLRISGYLTDQEFVRECATRGIKVFGVVFQSQAWEFPIETNDEETELLSFNILRGVGKKGWL